MVVDNCITGSWSNLADAKESPNLTCIEADVTQGLPVDGSFDWIFHMASPASPKEFKPLAFEILEVNSVGTKNCLELAEKTGATMLFASTSEVYGDPEFSPQPESYWGNVNPNGVRSVYDESKRFGEAMTAAFQRAGRADTRMVRYFNTFGPRMRPADGRVVSNMICQAIAGEPLTVYGDGSQTRSFGFCDDSVRGTILLAESDTSDPVNIGTENEFTVLELAEMVIRLTGSSSTITHLPALPDDPKQRRPDLTRARSVLGYEPQVSLEDGLQQTIAFFKDRLNLVG